MMNQSNPTLLEMNAITPETLAAYRSKLSCRFPQIDAVFADCLAEALVVLSPPGVEEYLDGASLVCKIGRGVEPVLAYLEEMPGIAARLGEASLSLVSESVWKMSRSPNGNSIPPFMHTLPEAARRLGSYDQLFHYIKLVFDLLERTSTSIHGNQAATFPSPGLPEMLLQVPRLLAELSLDGLRQWIEYGIRNYHHHPEQQREYFSLRAADSRTVLLRARHGTLFIDHERQLDLYLRALWQCQEHLTPYSEAFSEQHMPMPYFDSHGIRLPDVYGHRAGVDGIDRYRALLAHVAAHKRWSTPMIADNFSPFQRIAIEHFEDCRVEWLAMREYPGLRRLWSALHPAPQEHACNPAQESCIRHRLTLFSRAVLRLSHDYRNPDILEFTERFHEMMAHDRSSTAAMAELAVAFIARTRRPGDLSANVYFTDTIVDYRDDNRHLWLFIEDSDDEDFFPRESKPQTQMLSGLPPRHYPEWDYRSQTYRPDWVSLYESLHPAGDAMRIDLLLSKHDAVARRLARILDLLKPQQYVRLRYQEEGSELDLDVAIRALIDLKSGATPDLRINMSHRHDGRNIAVMLLLDLSESLAATPPGCAQTILELSQEAVALLGWAVDRLGDEFAIAGFSSNTRHEVRYQHIKGYGEPWDDRVKARLAALQAGYSTRMGAALRHAAHYLAARNAEKKLLLVLTDGEPSDIDTPDSNLLIQDARKAIQEITQQGIYPFCINLDANADTYVGEIFGKQYLVIDRVARLPEQLTRLFARLTQ